MTTFNINTTLYIYACTLIKEMKMKKELRVNTYIDTLGIRCECDNREQRDNLFDAIIDCLIERKTVGIKYDEKHSSKYYQITKLQHGNTTLATIAKGYYINDTSFDSDYFYINISFYGLKRYNKIKDDASLLLVRTITAFLNTYNIDFRLIELDVAMDIQAAIDKYLAVCVNRSPNIDYFQLGETNANGEKIQKDEGSYYVENYQSKKQEKNAMSRAYLYDKRRKELIKYKRDIGFELTRFEMKFQKRWFVKNEFGTIPIYKALQKYAVLEFKDNEQKEQLIEKLNSTKKAKQRRKLIDDAIENNNALLHTQKMNNVGSFLRDIATIKFDSKGEFVFTKHEDYLEYMSKLNRRR